MIFNAGKVKSNVKKGNIHGKNTLRVVERLCYLSIFSKLDVTWELVPSTPLRIFRITLFWLTTNNSFLWRRVYTRNVSFFIFTGSNLNLTKSFDTKFLKVPTTYSRRRFRPKHRKKSKPESFRKEVDFSWRFATDFGVKKQRVGIKDAHK